MSYLPPPAKLAGLHLANEQSPAHCQIWENAKPYQATRAVVVWPHGEIRLAKRPIPALHWAEVWIGFPPDEAAFDALVKQHFPDLMPPAHVHRNL